MSCIVVVASNGRAATPGPAPAPYAPGLEIGAGAIAERGRELTALLSPSARLADVVRPVVGLSEERQIEYVQAVVGQLVAWRSDDDLYGRPDRWASPGETLARRAGDCEDIAILKLAALAEMGFASERLALVVGRDRARGDHAIAAVRGAEGWRLLDDDGEVRRPASLPRFEPIYSLVDGHAFLHGRERAARPAAS